MSHRQRHAPIIEAEDCIPMDIECRLSELGFTSLDRAATEEDAVALAHERRPDPITADQRLKEGTGVSAVRRIAGRHAIPVIDVTGSPDETDGVADAIVVEKPCRSRRCAAAGARTGGAACRSTRRTRSRGPCG